MNQLEPVDLKDFGMRPGPSSVRTSKKLVVGSLSILILVVMIAWFGFLGWGALELMRELASFIKNL
jgi:hypothetical protein